MRLTCTPLRFREGPEKLVAVVYWRTSLACLILSAWATNAQAQTWAGPGTTPDLRQLVAVDATGEANWPFGSEDIAGDGANVFRAPEPSLDLRTVYAATDGGGFWLRLYVSDERAASESLVAYVFVDTDENDSTGGPALAPEIDPALDTDVSAGGYEIVVGVRGDGESPVLFQWRNAQQGFVSVAVDATEVAGEVGRDVDPIRLLSDTHGYLQATVPLESIGISAACDANLFVRSVEHADSSVARDLDVGRLGRCVPRDTNDNRVPDLLEPGRCTSHAQCAARGVCVDESCVIAPPCADDSDCEDGEACSEEGACVVVPSGECTDNDDCGARLCLDGECSSCLEGGSCGSGRTCGPDGRCVDGSPTDDGNTGQPANEPGDLLDPGEEVQGGACTCNLPRTSRYRATAFVLIAFGASMFGLRRARRLLGKGE